MDELPDDLAPTQRAAIDALLAEVSLVPHREHKHVKDYQPNRCAHCHKTGRLFESQTATGDTVFVHRRCALKVRGW